MKKDAFYFPHYSNARGDRKLKRVIKDLGIEGYGIYFMLLEVLRDQQEFKYPISDADLLADEFGTSEAKISAVIKLYDLFQVDIENNFFSLKQILYLQPYIEKTQRARNAANIKWNKLKELNENNNANAYANAMHLECMGNASKVKESKVKQSKIEESKENELVENLSIFSETVSKEEIEKVIKKKKETEPPLIFPYESEKFKVAWGALVLTKKWKPKLNYSLQLSLDKLKKYDEEFAILMIEEATEKGWQGLEYENTQEKYQKYLNHKNGIKNGTANQGTNLTARLERNQSFGTL